MISQSFRSKKSLILSLLLLTALVSIHIKAQLNGVNQTYYGKASNIGIANHFGKAAGKLYKHPSSVTSLAAIQAPNISYTNHTQTYTTGVAINPLVVANSGGTVPAAAYGQVTTIAGSGTVGNINGTGTAGSFNRPTGVAADAAGNLYVADMENNLIRKVTPVGVVTTLAGSGVRGNFNGTGTEASFSNPSGIAVDATGNVYVADQGNNLIRKINPAGAVTTLAGSGVAGYMNGTGGGARFYEPTGVTVDAAGNVYVADQGNNCIRKITPAGLVTTFAGSGAEGKANGMGAAASFYSPSGVAVDAADNVYVADADNHLIRKISPIGVVTTFAGSGATGFTNGTGAGATFGRPYGLAVDELGNVYVADYGLSLIRKISPAGVVTLLAGSGNWGKTDGAGTTASFTSTRGITVDATGSVYVTDEYNNLIRRINSTGYSISPALPDDLTFDLTTGTISGTPTVTSPATTYTITAYNTGGSSSTTVNLTVNAAVILPTRVSAPAIRYANDAQILIAGTPIGALTPANTGGAVPAAVYGQVTTLAGSGAQGKADGPGNVASFFFPFGLTVDVNGNVYVADESNHLIRKITPAGVVSTIAGSGIASDHDGDGMAASFNHPTDLVIDRNGRIYVADAENNKIRKISPLGQVSTFAGNGDPGITNGIGTGASASFYRPAAITLDVAGNLYVADAGSNLIRKINPDGKVKTLAGSGTGKENGTGAAASFNGPNGIATDIAGNVYVTEYNNLIRKISPEGVVTTFAGSGLSGKANGPATAASFWVPIGIVTDLSGNVYVVDGGNSLIRKISPTGQVTTLAGSGAYGSANGIGTAATFSNPTGLALDEAGNLYTSDTGNNLIRKISVAGYTISPALPPGLSFDGTSGTIAGTPTALSPPTLYTITAYNGGGSSSAKILIAVGNSRTFGTMADKAYGDADFSVGNNGTGANTYGSSNPDVATIDNGQVHITGAGTSTIVISDGSNIKAQTLTVNKAPLTITADNKIKTYGSANPPFTATYSGFINGETAAVLSSQPIISTTAVTGSAAGSYPIAANSATSNNYDVTYVNGTMTVNRAPLTITAKDQSKIYGDANPTLTAIYSGLVNGDSAAVFTTQLVIATTATTTSAAGTYPITVSGAVANNYTIGYTNGTLTVDKAPLMIKAADQSKTYGDANLALTATYSGFVNGDSTAMLSKQPTIATTATDASAAGTYAITASGAASDNYSINYVNGILKVNKAELSIIADSKSKTYGAANPTLTAAYSGFVNGETAAMLINRPTITTAATSVSTAGVYPITVSGAASDNYAITYVDNTLTIYKAALTISADDQSKTYGAANPALTATYSGFVNGETAARLINQPIIATTAVTGSATGVYPISVSGAASANYEITYESGTLIVNQAALTIAANNQSKIYGEVNPIMAATYSGFVNGETAAILSEQPIITTTALTASKTGTYPITVGGASADNYAIVYANGTLTVNKAPLTITANDQSKTYGADNPTLTAIYSGFTNNETAAALRIQPAIATTAATNSSTGDYPITVSGAASDNYAISYANGTLTVTKAALTITADNQSKTYGADNPTLTATYSGLRNGETAAMLGIQPMLATTATTESLTGTYPITLSSAGASTNNYSITYVPGSLTVIPAPAPVITSVSPSTVIAGMSVTITGSHLLGATSVNFGGVAASSSVVNSSTSISAVVAGASSNGMSVTTTTGTGNFSGFNVVPVPTITSAGPTTILTGSSVVLTAVARGSGYAYQWLKDGAAISGATSANYTVNQNGLYTVQIMLNSVSQISQGITVTSVFALPASNYKLLITGATCKGSNNGSVNITAAQTLNYTANITGNGLTGTYPFSSSQTIGNLAAGTYNICITVQGQPGYQQCFTVVVTEPKDLSVYSTINPKLNTVNLVLNGSSRYNITLNGNTYTTTDQAISLPLITGINKLSIVTDQLCQGKVEQTINNTGMILPYPNPFYNIVNINLGLVNVRDIIVEITSVTNANQVLKKQYSNQSGVLPLDVSNLKSGVYALRLSLNGNENIFKIIKK